MLDQLMIPSGCSCMYTGTLDCQLLRLFCSLLGLFEPVHAQDVQIRSTAQRVLPAALLLLEKYHNIILMLQKNSDPQIHSTKEDSPQKNS
jgi:hypothetical protein